MASYILSPVGGAGQQFFSNAGAPLAGGQLFTYAAGTTTPQTTYADSGGVTPNANPIVLDSSGRVSGEVWLTYQTSYKFVLKDSLGNTLGTWDNVPDQVQSGLITTLNTEVAALDAIANCMLRYTPGAQTITSGQLNIVKYNTKVFDVGNNFNTTTWTFTAPANGNYLITSSIALIPAVAPTIGGYVRMDLNKNGNSLYNLDITYVKTSDVYLYNLKGSVLVSLVTGDTLQIAALNETSQTVNITPTNTDNISIARIS